MSRSGFISRFISVSKKNFKDLMTRSFEVRVRGRIFQGFVVRKDGKFFAYRNLCQHLPIALDLNDNAFFNHDKTLLQCHMHGALYRIETGECVAGPCEGAKLAALEFREDTDQIVITIPEAND